MSWIVEDTSRETERQLDTRSEAEEAKSNMVALGANPEDIDLYTTNAHSEPEEEATPDGGTETIDPPVVDNSEEETEPEPESESDATMEQAAPMASEGTSLPVDGTTEPSPEDSEALDQLGESLDTDPLSILPGYMITEVEGQPSLNKRGVSVLAYHYGISVVDREVVAYPHETDHESAIYEMMVETEDGRRFAGSGEAHVDETPKHQLLRMAETRAYKRAVIFATGTGIVGYQEIMEELQ